MSTRDRELYEGFCVSSGIGTPGQKSGFIPKNTFVLAVPDPSSARVGRYKYIL